MSPDDTAEGGTPVAEPDTTDMDPERREDVLSRLAFVRRELLDLEHELGINPASVEAEIAALRRENDQLRVLVALAVGSADALIEGAREVGIPQT